MAAISGGGDGDGGDRSTNSHVVDLVGAEDDGEVAAGASETGEGAGVGGDARWCKFMSDVKLGLGEKGLTGFTKDPVLYWIRRDVGQLLERGTDVGYGRTEELEFEVPEPSLDLADMLHVQFCGPPDAEALNRMFVEAQVEAARESRLPEATKVATSESTVRTEAGAHSAVATSVASRDKQVDFDFDGAQEQVLAVLSRKDIELDERTRDMLGTLNDEDWSRMFAHGGDLRAHCRNVHRLQRLVRVLSLRTFALFALAELFCSVHFEVSAVRGADGLTEPPAVALELLLELCRLADVAALSYPLRRGLLKRMDRKSVPWRVRLTQVVSKFGS